MIRNVEINKSEHQRLLRPMFFTLLDGLTQAQGSKGEVLVMDVQDASILCDVALEESNGEPGKMVFCSSRVTNVECIRMEVENGPDYVEAKCFAMLPVEIIMPVVSYLAFAKCGCQPTDVLEWKGSSITLENAFVKGQFEPLVSDVMQLFPDGIDQLLYGFMYKLGIIAIHPNKDPSNLQELMRNEWVGYLTLDLLNQVSLGEGIYDKSSTDNDEPPHLVVSPESVQMMKETLRKSGNEVFAKLIADEENNISGYTYVTKQDANRNRHICFLGYFPADNPKYGIMVWMQRKEQLQDVVRDDWPELGEYAAQICMSIADYIMNNETKQIDENNEKI